MKDWLLAAAAAIGAIAYLYADWRMPSVALGDPLGPRAFPALVGGLLLISAGLLALENWRRKPVAASAPRVPGRSHMPVLLGVLVWTICYYAAFEPAGYVVATVVYLFGLLCYFNRGHHLANIAIAGTFTAAAYTLFSYGLDVQLPLGPLGV
jgi:putative tricarboxylic transport membrane protein